MEDLTHTVQATFVGVAVDYDMSPDIKSLEDIIAYDNSQWERIYQIWKNQNDELEEHEYEFYRVYADSPVLASFLQYDCDTDEKINCILRNKESRVNYFTELTQSLADSLSTCPGAYGYEFTAENDILIEITGS